VPQKTILSGGTNRLPLAGLFHLADLPPDHVAFKHAQVTNEEHSVQMVNLVAECAR
jgi:hypothetical protein